MKVILLDNIRALGKVGELKDVRDGYARNFLFPRTLARVASEGVVKDVEQIKSKRLAAYDLAQSDARALAEKLQGIVIELSAPANEQGTLFSAISAEQIAPELSQKAGARVDATHIIISEPIKSVGDHTVTLDLTEEVSLDLKVVISKS